MHANLLKLITHYFFLWVKIIFLTLINFLDRLLLIYIKSKLVKNCLEFYSILMSFFSSFVDKINHK
jgi:hypothetical protein